MTTHNSLVIAETLVVIQLVLSYVVTVMAAPLTPESEWSAMVIPITWSPITANRGRLTAQIEPFRYWNHLNLMATPSNSKFAGTVTEASYLYSTCHGFSCHGMNRGKNLNAENHHVKNPRGQNRHEKKQCGKKQHDKRCIKNSCEKRRGKNRNESNRHNMNCHRENKLHKMKNSKKHRDLIVENKVIVNVNDDQTPSSTLLGVETTVVAKAPITLQSFALQFSSLNYCGWNLNIVLLSLLAFCLLIIFGYNALVVV